MIRSAKPSPFTSPAEETEKPEKSPAASPEIWKPLVPLSAERSRLAAKPRVPEHHVARAGLRSAWARPIGADDEIGKAVAVHVPRRGDRKARVVAATSPEIWKPFAPSSAERSRFDANPTPARTPRSSPRSWPLGSA